MTVDDVIAAYIKYREQKEDLERETKEAVALLKEKMSKLEGWIKTQADAQGVTSFKTPHGTAFVTTSDYASVADWDAVLEYIKTNDAYDLLERRVSKQAVRGRIDAEGAVPDGVNFGTKIGVSVRRPVTRVED